MKVYVEYVLIDNLIIDFIILKATYTISHKAISRGRLFLCSLFGAVLSLVFPLVDFSLIFISILKILAGAIIVLLSSNYNSIREFFITFISFLSLTFLFGGLVYGIYNIFQIDITSISIGIMILPIYLFSLFIISLVKYLKNTTKLQNFYCECKIINKDREFTSTAFIDSGNNLLFNNEQVVVISKKIAFKILTIEDYKECEYYKYKTSAGISKMPIFLIDKLIIKYDIQNLELTNVYIGIGETGEKNILLSPLILGGYYEQNNQKDKRVN